MTYIDLHPTAHQRYAAYETDYQDALSRQYDLMQQEIEQRYELGKEEISSRLSAAKIGASASTKSAQIGANATIKAAKIRAEVDRYGIDTQAAVEREKIGLAREEMMKIGIPGVLIDAWTAEKNYELEKQRLGLDIAALAAEYRSTPDRYWLAAEFEAVLPNLLEGAAGTAGGGMNGPVGAVGTPTANSLGDLVNKLSGTTGGATGGTGTAGGPLGATGGGSIYDQVLALTQGGGTAGDVASKQKVLGDALVKSGLAGAGSYPIDAMTQADLDGFLGTLRAQGVSPDDPRLSGVLAAAKSAGYTTTAADQWLGQVGASPAETINRAALGQALAASGFGNLATVGWTNNLNPAEWESTKNAIIAQYGADDPRVKQLIAAAEAAGYTGGTGYVGGGGATDQMAGMSPQDKLILSGISQVYARGLDPFVLDKLSPSQLDMLLAGGARLGYSIPTEVYKAEARRPGQGDPYAA